MPTLLQPHNDNRSKEYEITGRFVLFALLGFFGVVIAVNFTMARLAVSTFGGVEVASAYKAGLAFGADTRAAHAQDALGWKVEGAVDRAANGAVNISVAVRDAAGHEINGLDVAVELHHPADARRDIALAARPGGNGIYIAASDVPAGQWTLEVDILKDDAHAFRSSSRVVIP
ncbi:membrane protein [Terrihabitans soli]|uniref:Membrane protein n=1 Tax=Terrihabitans soli TaxID=708113 RepID=A0A6S6QYD4_9HYPH|nr:FixH family protein [Terrihabitans soli]BCJ92282.1 membrane protein [Terrihabitans soli]